MTTTATRTAIDWTDARSAVAHALECGPRLGWTATLGELAAADVDGDRGEGDALAVTYTRGNGSAAQTITARFRVVTGLQPAPEVDPYRFSGGDLALAVGEQATPVRTWGAIMAALKAAPAKAHRAPKGGKARTRRTA